jgi:hypothetical protein
MEGFDTRGFQSVAMETVFEELSAPLSAAPCDWRGRICLLALKLVSNLATGLAICVGVAIGMAIAG